MPDYNAAVAAGIQPPQPVAQQNFGNTLSTVADFQRAQAATQLSQLQALQQQRKYNGLMAFNQALAHNPKDAQGALHAGLAAGGDPQEMTAGLGAVSTANFVGTHGGLNAEGALANANISRAGAETAKTQAGIPGEIAGSDAKIADLSAQHANQYIANPTQANWDDNVALTKKYKGPLAAAQLDNIKDRDQRMALMRGHVGGGLTAEQAKPQAIPAGSNILSPTDYLAGRGAVNPTAPSASGPAGTAAVSPNTIGSNKTQELDAQQYSKLLGGLQGAGNNAASMLPHIQMAKALINSPDFYSGSAEGAVLGYKRFLAATGIDPGASLPQEAFRKTMAANILNQVDDLKATATEMGAGSSRIFASQIDLMEKAAQNPDNSIAANRFLTELSDRAAQRGITLADKAADYKQAHGSLDVGFEKDLRGWMAKNPMFTAKELANPQSIGAPSSANQSPTSFREGQTATNPKTGAKMTFTNGAWK